MRYIRRREKMLMLVEELSLRTRRVQPLMRQLEEMSRRMDELQAAARRRCAQTGAPPDKIAPIRHELRELMLLTLESPAQPAPPHAACCAASTGSSRTSSASSPAATCGWWFRSPRSTATAA